MNGCAHCGLAFDPVRFPLARARKDGTRGHFRYCDTCLALPSRRGRKDAVNYAHRAWRRRVAYAKWAA
jgi:hypothetical protein